MSAIAIRSYSKYFAQADKLSRTAPVATAAPVVEKPAAGEHRLLKNGRKVIFTVTSQLVTVKRFSGPWCDGEETVSWEAARETYAKLIGFGWEKW